MEFLFDQELCASFLAGRCWETAHCLGEEGDAPPAGDVMLTREKRKYILVFLFETEKLHKNQRICRKYFTKTDKINRVLNIKAYKHV